MDGDVAEKGLAVAFHYLEVGQPQRALAALDGLAGAGLEEPRAWFARGQALYDLERYAEAADVAKAGLA